MSGTAVAVLPRVDRLQGQVGVFKIGKQLSGTMDAMGALENTEDEKNLLADLTNLAGELEQAAAATNYRFGAARAYHALVSKRIEELRESRLEGYQQFGEFMDRRLAPAMRTCEAVAQRMESLSERLARASQMLRTRVDIQLEEQNRNLLHSMDRRARLQLRLQETVEGLSIAAVTYYGVGLIAYLAKGLKQTGLAVPVEIILAVSVPVIAGSALLVVRRIRRIVSREQN
ncbi:MAG: DUF3422 domain-containing protein [Limibacillus sp.]